MYGHWPIVKLNCCVLLNDLLWSLKEIIKLNIKFGHEVYTLFIDAINIKFVLENSTNMNQFK